MNQGAKSFRDAVQSAPILLLSFIIRSSGTLLDGTPLEDAVASVDDATDRPPVGYLVNCVHPTVLRTALEGSPRRRDGLCGRLLGLQANTSTKSPEELDGAETLEGEAPDAFARAMVSLRQDFGLKVFGGCCGTDGGHMDALAKALVGSSAR